MWRRLKRLGVAQIGDGLVALPADARTKEHLEWVASQVEEAGGTSTLWRAAPLSNRQEQQLIHDLASARAAEYENIAERAETVSDQDAARVLTSLRRELRQVERRDHFPPQERERTLAAIRTLAARVAGLERSHESVAS